MNKRAWFSVLFYLFNYNFFKVLVFSFSKRKRNILIFYYTILKLLSAFLKQKDISIKQVNVKD
jgi:hypothetical protein